MIALPRHADDLLSMVVLLLLLPGFMSTIVHLAACFVVFSGGDRWAIHICLRFVVAKNLIIRLSIHLLICISCIVCLARVITCQISYTICILSSTSCNFVMAVLLKMIEQLLELFIILRRDPACCEVACCRRCSRLSRLETWHSYCRTVLN